MPPVMVAPQWGWGRTDCIGPAKTSGAPPIGSANGARNVPGTVPTPRTHRPGGRRHRVARDARRRRGRRRRAGGDQGAAVGRRPRRRLPLRDGPGDRRPRRPGAPPRHVGLRSRGRHGRGGRPPPRAAPGGPLRRDGVGAARHPPGLARRTPTELVDRGPRGPQHAAVGPRPRPRARADPSRHQAREPPPGWGRGREDHRLRPRPRARAGRPRGRPGGGHAAVHGPRADHGAVARSRPLDRPLRRRRDRVAARDREPPLPEAGRSGVGPEVTPPPGPPLVCADPRPPARVRGVAPAAPGEEPPVPVPVRRGRFVGARSTDRPGPRPPPRGDHDARHRRAGPSGAVAVGQRPGRLRGPDGGGGRELPPDGELVRRWRDHRDRRRRTPPASPLAGGRLDPVSGARTPLRRARTGGASPPPRRGAGHRTRPTVDRAPRGEGERSSPGGRAQRGLRLRQERAGVLVLRAGPRGRGRHQPAGPAPRRRGPRVRARSDARPPPPLRGDRAIRDRSEARSPPGAAEDSEPGRRVPRPDRDDQPRPLRRRAMRSLLGAPRTLRVGRADAGRDAAGAPRDPVAGRRPRGGRRPAVGAAPAPPRGPRPRAHDRAHGPQRPARRPARRSGTAERSPGPPAGRGGRRGAAGGGPSSPPRGWPVGARCGGPGARLEANRGEPAVRRAARRRLGPARRAGPRRGRFPHRRGGVGRPSGRSPRAVGAAARAGPGGSPGEGSTRPRVGCRAGPGGRVEGVGGGLHRGPRDPLPRPRRGPRGAAARRVAAPGRRLVVRARDAPRGRRRSGPRRGPVGPLPRRLRRDAGAQHGPCGDGADRSPPDRGGPDRGGAASAAAGD